jgi:hypothetical protein
VSNSPESIYDAAAKLPREARAELSARLAGALEDEDDSVEEIEAAWIAEVKRRKQEVEAGDVELFDADEVEAELLELIAATRASVEDRTRE